LAIAFAVEIRLCLVSDLMSFCELLLNGAALSSKSSSRRVVSSEIFARQMLDWAAVAIVGKEVKLTHLTPTACGALLEMLEDGP
jgi:hypothetical protein